MNGVPFAGRVDPRERRYIRATRILWQSGAIRNAEALLADGDAVATLRPGTDAEPTAILLDFGTELHGGIRIDAPRIEPKGPARFRVRFGESASEAMGAPNNDHALHDTVVDVPWMGHAEIGNTGFRFARLDLLDTQATVELRQVLAVAILRPLDYLGSFECSDPLLSRIWQVGATTVHLCMQDHVWDGIKRDRLVWIGDLHPEQRVVSTVFGDVDVVPASLDYARDHTPLPAWMNGISSYSLWWILCHRDWFQHHGDRAYLAQQRGYLLGLLAQVADCLDAQGCEHLTGGRFLEWPTSRDATAIDAGLQALTVLALRAGADLCRALGEESAATRATAGADRAAAFRRPPTASKQANALAVLGGMADAADTNRTVLAQDPHRGLSTFYGYYILQARALAGDHAGCLALLRAYWGGMLQMGATTFWEGFDIDWMDGSAPIDELVPEGTRDIHADFGDYCYEGLRHSLCHGWAAGPTAWLTEHVLGLAPAAPGFARLAVRPHLSGLQYARGTLPTPHGIVRVEHVAGDDGRVETTIDAPDGIEIVRDAQESG